MGFRLQYFGVINRNLEYFSVIIPYYSPLGTLRLKQAIYKCLHVSIFLQIHRIIYASVRQGNQIDPFYFTIITNPQFRPTFPYSFPYRVFRQRISLPPCLYHYQSSTCAYPLASLHTQVQIASFPPTYNILRFLDVTYLTITPIQ